MSGTLFRNAKIIAGDRITDGDLLVRDGKIAGTGQGLQAGNCDEIDAGGRYLSPGFIDLHCHGGGGHDFMDGTAEAFLGAAELHLSHGTTAMLPTTVSASAQELTATLKAMKSAMGRNPRGTKLLGLHLEGPYLAPEQKGAMDLKYIRLPDRAEYEAVCREGAGVLRRWTIAPELEGAPEMGKFLVERGILPSIGHSDATFEQTLRAQESGFRLVTHLYSATSTVRRIGPYRVAGINEAAFFSDGMFVEIIADGCHLPESLLKLIYKLKGAEKIALVTDAMRAAGQPEGPTILGSLASGRTAIVEDGVAKLPDGTAFAGSVATADRLIRTMVQIAGVPLEKAVRMMTRTPAEILGIERQKGRIAIGMDADLVLFDRGIDVSLAMVEGEIRFRK